jgi:hypothetical protein
LLAVCRLDRKDRWPRLSEVLDVDGYLSHLTIEMFTSHTDGYAMNRNNYRLYHDPSTDRIVFLAHGIDWAFQNGGILISQAFNSIVTKAVLETAEGRRGYRERTRQLFTNVFQVELLTNRVNTAVARLLAAAHHTNEARDFLNYGAEMRQRILARHRNVADQLARPESKRPQFAPDGSALLTDWYTKKERGEGAHDQPRVEDRETLHLRVDKGETIISWRALVLLEEGRYTFEGRVRTAGIVALTNKVTLGNGAGMRISGLNRARSLTGDNPWTEWRQDFEAVAGDEKELVCEVRGSRGEAWFDRASLRLVRRP